MGGDPAVGKGKVLLIEVEDVLDEIVNETGFATTAGSPPEPHLVVCTKEPAHRHTPSIGESLVVQPTARNMSFMLPTLWAPMTVNIDRVLRQRFAVEKKLMCLKFDRVMYLPASCIINRLHAEICIINDSAFVQGASQDFMTNLANALFESPVKSAFFFVYATFISGYIVIF